MKGDIMIYTVKRIEEDVDYGCEERPEDVPVMAVVTLTNSLGEELVIKAEDAMLYECNINEGDKVSIDITFIKHSILCFYYQFFSQRIGNKSRGCYAL